MAESRTDIAHDETERLIASSKVEGTAVYDSAGEKIGTIHNFMVEKRTGQVEYAVLSSGGLFGRQGRYYPIPWNELRYDTDRGGYVVGHGRDRFDDAPSYEAGSEPRYDPDYDERVRGHYRR
jgi:sporulation protein YlmC with PRC-barrel domain